LIELSNNINGQLTPRLGKLMEETASVFWVDLRYRLRNWDRVSLQGFTAGFPGMTDLPYCYCYIVTIVPGDTAWFSARSLGHGLGYIRDPPKVWTMSLTDQFQ